MVGFVILVGEININQDNVQDLMVAADMLELKEVVGGCTEFLKHELHATNAIGIYRYKGLLDSCHEQCLRTSIFALQIAFLACRPFSTMELFVTLIL
jgi:hypothetical protein